MPSWIGGRAERSQAISRSIDLARRVVVQAQTKILVELNNHPALRAPLLSRGCCKTQGKKRTRVGLGVSKIVAMSYQREANYSAQWLFPPSLEDLLPSDHPARMVREFVDAMDMEALGFRMRTADKGRPNYSSSLLLKVWLYGYLSKVRSNRGLERACLDSIGMMWLTGMLRPDHTTLWRFWRDNRKALRAVFKRLLQVAASMNLVGMVLHAVDGTKILSQACEFKALHRTSLEKTLARLDEAIDEIMRQTEAASVQDSGESRLPESLQQQQELRQKIADQLKQLDQSERDHLNPGDPEARMMKCRVGKKFAYNAQAVVDEQSRMVVAADVVTDESDNYQLAPMLEQVEENLGRVADETAGDGAYNTTTQLAQVQENGHEVLVPMKEPKDQPYHATQFTYDAQEDHYVCPQGEVLKFEGTKTRDKVEPYDARVYQCQSYTTCPVRWQCSKSQTGRTVHLHPQYKAQLRQREKLKDPSMRALLKKRGSLIETVFGWAKEGFGFRRWSVRGLEKVEAQWLLMCTAMNLRKLHHYWASGKVVFS